MVRTRFDRLTTARVGQALGIHQHQVLRWSKLLGFEAAQHPGSGQPLYLSRSEAAAIVTLKVLREAGMPLTGSTSLALGAFLCGGKGWAGYLAWTPIDMVWLATEEDLLEELRTAETAIWAVDLAKMWALAEQIWSGADDRGAPD